MALRNWLGRRNDKPERKPEQKPGQPPVENGKLREFIASLPANDSVRALGEIASWLKVLNTATDVELGRRFEQLDLLDDASHQPESKLFADYLATPRQKKAREQELWTSAFYLWRLLGEGYQKCQQLADGEPESAFASRASAAMYIARALRCLRQQLRWHLMRYELPETRVWTTMAQLLAIGESKEVLEESIALHPGSSDTSTVKQEFLKGAMLAASSTDALQPAEQDIAVRLISYFSGMFLVSKEPQGHTHWVDLAAPKAPARILRDPPKVPSVRYFSAGPALRELEQLRAYITTSRSLPEGLILGEQVDHEAVLRLLRHLELDWAGKSQMRRHERTKIAARITVVPGFREIVSAVEFGINDSLDFVRYLNSAESWIVQDVSAGGYGAMIPAIAGDWVEVGTVIGIEEESFRQWRVGVIRRVTRAKQWQHIGVQVLAPVATLLSLRSAGAPSARTSTSAIMISPQIMGEKEVEILTPQGHCAERNGVEAVLNEKTYRLVPVGIVERSSDYDRVKFTVER